MASSGNAGLVRNATATPMDDGRTEYRMKITRPCTLVVRGPLGTSIALTETTVVDKCEFGLTVEITNREEQE